MKELICREGKQDSKLQFIIGHNLLPIKFIDKTDKKFEVQSVDDNVSLYFRYFLLSISYQ